MGRSVSHVPDADVVAYDTFEPDEAFYLQQWREKPADERREIAQSRADFDIWMLEQFRWDAEYEWEAYVEWISTHARELWPSLEEVDDWIGENHVILANAHSIVAVSEYCGAVSISLAPRYDRDTYWRDSGQLYALGSRWRASIAERFESTFSTLRKIGTFSNGESVYERIA